MNDHIYDIAVLGAGPGGLSAAAHAAELGVAHILLESSPKIANTIQKYQKGKHVMAEPGILPLRSPIEFDAGTREVILGSWEEGIALHETNVRFGAEVSKIEGEKGAFVVGLSSGEAVTAKNLILGIGMQGNPRQLGVPGDQSDFIQYQLDDPDEYHDENIAVIGAGDAAIENAIALAKHNNVYIVNRKDEFARAKEGNLNLILAAIDSEEIGAFYSSSPTEVEILEGEKFRGNLVLSTNVGIEKLPVHRVIGRLGAIPPRGLVESFGIEFPSKDMSAIPALPSQYESNVTGIYVIGALGGYPLIKQAMNQGYEVVEYILGHDVKPADHGLIEDKFKALPYDNMEVDDVLTMMQERIPIFSSVNALLFRELILDSTVHVFNEGDVVFERDDYTNSFYTVLEGGIKTVITEDLIISSAVGAFTGEGSLLSGRRRSATVLAGDQCILIETPRRTMLKLIASIESVKRVLDETFIVRQIQTKFAPNTDIKELEPIASKAVINSYTPGQVIMKEGDEGDTFHLIRSGSVTVSNEVNGKELIRTYLPAGADIGEMALLGDTTRSATIKATVKTETVSIDKEAFEMLLSRSPGLREELQEKTKKRYQENVKLQGDDDSDGLLSFLMDQGLGEATSALMIDEDLCVGCDLCEQACAATHDGTSRMNRSAGPTHAHIHVPTSCRHCESPHCMKDCPPNAIQRMGGGGEVVIGDNCIGLSLIHI